MKISELMIKDVRATIECEDGNIIIKNPKGDVKNELLLFFKEQLDRNMDNASKQRERKKKVASNIDILLMLMSKLTNVEIDVDNPEDVLSNPSHELNMVQLYLASIMQELIFEVLSTHNLEMRMEQNTILEKDTLYKVKDLENLIKEIKYRELIKNGETV